MYVFGIYLMTYSCRVPARAVCSPGALPREKVRQLFHSPHRSTSHAFHRMHCVPPSQSRRGFSLIELIAVIGIIVLVATFAVPATTSIMRGSQLTQASQMLIDQISLGRQYALSKNRAVEVRFIRFADPEQPGETSGDPKTGQFRALQLMEINETGTPVPLSKMQMLPNAVVLSDTELSSMLDQEGDAKLALTNPVPGRDPDLPRKSSAKGGSSGKVDYEFVSFRFQPDGSTNLLPSQDWFLTIHSLSDSVKLQNPQRDVRKINFFTVQVDPISGSTRSFRPSAG